MGKDLLFVFLLNMLLVILQCNGKFCGQVVVSSCPENEIQPWNNKGVPEEINLWLKSLRHDDEAIAPIKASRLHLAYEYPEEIYLSDTNTTMFKSIALMNCERGNAVEGLAWSVPKLYSDEALLNGFLYGKINSHGHFSGDNISWIYPDLETVLIGNFEDGIMKKARASKIIAERCNNGVKELKMEHPSENDASYKYFSPTPTKMCEDYTLMDPYEKKTIYLQSAGYTDANGDLGDTVFAKRDIQRGEIVAYYIGVKYHYRTFKNATEIEEQEQHKNLMTYFKEENYYLNILKPYWSITKYRATLGHKLNHSFRAKTRFNYAYHPRHGFTVIVKAIKNIKRGEEIFVHYHYAKKSYVPQWYADLYMEELGKEWQGKTWVDNYQL